MPRTIHPFPRCHRPARESRLSKLAFLCHCVFRRRRRTRLIIIPCNIFFQHEWFFCYESKHLEQRNKTKLVMCSTLKFKLFKQKSKLFKLKVMLIKLKSKLFKLKSKLFKLKSKLYKLKRKLFKLNSKLFKLKSKLFKLKSKLFKLKSKLF